VITLVERSCLSVCRFLCLSVRDHYRAHGKFLSGIVSDCLLLLKVVLISGNEMWCNIMSYFVNCLMLCGIIIQFMKSLVKVPQNTIFVISIMMPTSRDEPCALKLL
jgi:hypothetical protein